MLERVKDRHGGILKPVDHGRVVGIGVEDVVIVKLLGFRNEDFFVVE